MTSEQLISAYPRLYHMAEDGSWPSIRDHGLLSTEALVELFEIDETRKTQILERRRTRSVTLTHPVFGGAVVRDQIPMLEPQLAGALTDGLVPADWYLLLNRYVFFWVREERLQRLLNAQAYRARPHLVLEFDTADIVARHASRIRLTGMNTGNTRPRAFPRGLQTFRSIGDFPYDERRRTARQDAVVELAVTGGVPDAAELVRRVSRWHGAQHLEEMET